MKTKKNNKGWNRCIYCNKFISMSDFNSKKVISKYIPDTPFSTEEITHYHKKCKTDATQRN